MAINSSRDHLKVTLNPLAKKAEQVISLYGNGDGPKMKVIIMDIITNTKKFSSRQPPKMDGDRVENVRAKIRV